jgi:hypothetical protein
MTKLELENTRAGLSKTIGDLSAKLNCRLYLFFIIKNKLRKKLKLKTPIF